MHKKLIKIGPIEVFELVTECALDIICETAMGKVVNAQKSEKRSPYVDAVYNASKIAVQRMESPWLWNDFIFSLSSLGRENQKALKTLHDFTDVVIKERKAFLEENQGNRGSEDKRKAFLDILLSAQMEGEQLTDADIREEVDTFMFEGHDTTSASLAWTIHLIGKHPEVQAKLREEIDELFVDAPEGSTEVTYDMLSKLKYLELVLKESLRIYPSVFVISRVLSDDVVSFFFSFEFFFGKKN